VKQSNKAENNALSANENYAEQEDAQNQAGSATSHATLK
jgi:hypothetical protein